MSRISNLISHLLVKNGLRVLVIIPVILAAIYFTLLAHPIYEVTYQLNVEERHSNVGEAGISKFLSASPAARGNGFVVVEYILSPNILESLQSELDLRAHYSSPKRDIIKRLSDGASFESFLGYYRRRVTATQDPMSGIITVTVEAFDSQMSARIAKRIISLTEKALNEFSTHTAQIKVTFAETELHKDERRLIEAKTAILNFQQQNQVLDPALHGASKNQVIMHLESGVSQKKADLKELESYLQPESIQVRTLKQNIAALESQIAAETQLLTDSEKDGINMTMFSFDELKLKLEFALNTYKSSLANLEVTRLEATQQLKFLVVISGTPAPGQASKPNKMHGILVVLTLSFITFGIVQLIAATIREHTL